MRTARPWKSSKDFAPVWDRPSITVGGILVPGPCADAGTARNAVVASARTASHELLSMGLPFLAARRARRTESTAFHPRGRAARWGGRSPLPFEELDGALVLLGRLA